MHYLLLICFSLLIHNFSYGQVDSSELEEEPPKPIIFITKPVPFKDQHLYPLVKDLPFEVKRIKEVATMKELVYAIQDNSALLLREGVYDLALLDEIKLKSYNKGKINFRYSGVCNSGDGPKEFTAQFIQNMALMALDSNKPPRFINTSSSSKNINFVYSSNLMFKNLVFDLEAKYTEEFLGIFISDSVYLHNCRFEGPTKAEKDYKSLSYPLHINKVKQVDIQNMQSNGFLCQIMNLDNSSFFSIKNSNFNNLQYNTSPIRMCQIEDMTLENLHFEGIIPLKDSSQSKEIRMPLFHTYECSNLKLIDTKISNSHLHSIELKTGLFYVYKYKKDIKITGLKKHNTLIKKSKIKH